MASLKLKNWAEAEEDATRALRHDPSYQKAFFRRAQARDQLGKLDGAEMDYKENGIDTLYCHCKISIFLLWNAILKAVLKLEPSNKAAKKQLALLSERLHKNVKVSLFFGWKFSNFSLPSNVLKTVQKVGSYKFQFGRSITSTSSQ